MKSANHFPKIVLTGGSGFLGYNLLNNKVFQDALVIGRTPSHNHQSFKKSII